jgi:chromate transporter
MMEDNLSEKKGSLKEVASVFFKLGVIGFGGPAAHIAMMEAEIIEKRKWMDRQHFLDLMGATNLIPGPNSTEMTMHCGKERAGWPGLFVAGGAFIFPAVIMTLALAWFYVKYGEVPAIAPIFAGIKPAVLAIIAGAIFKLGKKALKNRTVGIIGAIVLVAAFMGLTEVVAILMGGVIALLWMGITRDRATSIIPLFALVAEVSRTDVSTMKLFWVFLKVGSILFGSGYVLVAYLQGELVEGLGWLTESQLLDAIAIGQFTPGPVLSTATFVGYQVGGFAGAAVATIGIFLPSFLFVLLLNPLVPMLRKSKAAAAFLDGVNIGAVAIMVAVTYALAESTLIDWKAFLILAVALFFTFGPKKLSSVWIVLIGMVMGYSLGLM